MSGDVQPRKRKDKKRKKDELGVEEPRGTAAVLGDGDVFMHSQHDHGTGGHWCAKIIFFSLLAVLITLIGLIILENRGLTELEANSVESRYSGVLEGWLEDAPDEDHHDEHTLELLKHHNEEDYQDQENSPSQEDDNDEEVPDEVDEDGHDDDDDDNNDDDIDTGNNDDDVNTGDNDDDFDTRDNDDDVDTGDNDDDVDDDYKDNDFNEAENEYDVISNEDDEQDDDDENQNYGENSDEHHLDDVHEEHEAREEERDVATEVENLEKEVSDEDLPSQEAEDENPGISSELPLDDDSGTADDADSIEDEEFLEADDFDEPLPVVEHIVVPKGKPLAEMDEEPITVKPADTLAEEEEYEKQQEELRKEQAEASHVWLKLAVGGALLVATHAVVSRTLSPRDGTPTREGHDSREDTPSFIERRMTLIPEEFAVMATQTNIAEATGQAVEETVFNEESSTIQTLQPYEESEEELEEEVLNTTKDITSVEDPIADIVTDDKELFSDEEEFEADEEEEVERIIKEEKEVPRQTAPITKKDAPFTTERKQGASAKALNEDVSADVEIIDDEQLEEELEEEEEDISDVDDAELLNRLEAKYGRLPEPDRPGQKHKDGGNSIEDEWPGEPSDNYWRQQLDQAEQELRQGDWSAASERVSATPLKDSARAQWIKARAIDASAEAKRDNRLLTRAITAYLDVLKRNERLSDDKLKLVAERTLDRIRFRGNYLSAEPVYRLLIRRFPDVVDHRNNLTVALLMANRADLAEQIIKETLEKWPNDRFALAHLGFILKTQYNRLEEAVKAFQKALEGDTGPAAEPRFYYHLGDAYLLLGRHAEAQEVHKRGAKLGHFLSPVQRSLYNVDRLKSRPWWDIEQTPYIKLARALEKSWKEILKEGQAAQEIYEKEKEGLKERGEWSQLDLFVRGQEVPGRCKRAPVTCSIVRSEPAAAGCRRGQIKFSAMEAGTHVRAHVGPTNCRLRMHLGLSNTKNTYIRVDQEIRQWQVGKVFMFDDSFEHEVWHNGTGSRLVLIVDVWHPALSPAERRSLPPI